MGTDIRIVVETKIGNHWQLIEVVRNDRATYRNYYRFSRLAGVRDSKGIEKTASLMANNDNFSLELPALCALGIPIDVSEGTRYHLTHDEGHDHSYMSLKQACDIFVKTDHNNSKYSAEYTAKYPESVYFGIDAFNNETESIDDYRIVFWFSS